MTQSFLRLSFISMASVAAFALVACGGSTTTGIGKSTETNVPDGGGKEDPRPEEQSTTPKDQPKGKPKLPPKADAQGACEHVNDVCAAFASDCDDANKKYSELDDAERARADELIACVMAANDCAAISHCAGGDETPILDAETACEHINDTCPTSIHQDCSHANEDYEDLSPSEQKQADEAFACIMQAKTCAKIAACAEGP